MALLDRLSNRFHGTENYNGSRGPKKARRLDGWLIARILLRKVFVWFADILALLYRKSTGELRSADFFS